MKTVSIWSDGACYPNPGPGGWGAVLVYGEARKEIWGGQVDTTNNQMELLAAIKALEALKEPCRVTLYTDSQYVQKGMELWVRGWISMGWRTANGSPVKNVEFWRQLVALDKTHQVKWSWVRGHDGNPNNEIADQLAVKGRLSVT